MHIHTYIFIHLVDIMEKGHWLNGKEIGCSGHQVRGRVGVEEI